GLLVFGAIANHDFGPRPAMILAMETAALIAALTHGAAIGIAVHAVAAVLFFVSGDTARPEMTARLAGDFGHAAVWVRMSLLYFILGGLLIAAVNNTVRRMAASLALARAAGERLRESDERLRFALVAASVGTWSMDADTGVVDWSRNVDRVLDTPRELLPRDRAEAIAWIHPDDRAPAAPDLEHGIQGPA